MKLFLVSAAYDGKKLCTNLIFYNPINNSLITIPDPYNHKPYCYIRPDYEPYIRVINQDSNKFMIKNKLMTDCIADRKVNMIKVIANDPLSIGGSKDSLRNQMVTWESNIKYYERYLFDNQFICGMWYDIDEGGIKPYYHDVDYSEVQQRLKLGDNEIYNEFVNYWVGLLNQPIPDIKRLAVDIEVEFDGDKFPSVTNPKQKITAIGFSSNDGFRKVLVLDIKSKYESNDTITYYKSEKQLLIDGLNLISKYPFIITFNGDAFDLPYLFARCNRLYINRDLIPLTIKTTRMADGAYIDPVYVKDAIHLDLYRFFKNRSIQNYALSHKYSEYSLDAISKGVLDEEKIKFQGSINDLTPDRLGEYCLNDADLTIKLTTFNDNLLIKLMVMISRIAKQPIDDICRYGVNQWGRGMIYSEMIKRGLLIPRADELLGKGFTASQEATIKEKKYKGAFVFEPTKGTYFGVDVLDFASLYPSIVKTYNISFETVKCPHKGCKTNIIPQTNSWGCKRKQGITSLIIGSLRDLRVSYYKYMSKKKGLTDEEHQLYDIVAQTLKVILNASYGIMGFESFPLYCLPVAESVTAYGRHIIGQTIKKAEELGLSVVYGDTDSIFVHGTNKTNIEQIIKWTGKNFGIDLEAEKHYRYLIMSERKKNYLGITDKGKPDVKGLTGKKSHTPVFIREMFFEMLNILKQVYDEKDLVNAKNDIGNMVKSNIDDLRNGKLSLEKLAYNIVVSKDVKSYGIVTTDNKFIDLHGRVGKNTYKSVPQHIKAAKMLQNVTIGSIVSIIKTNDEVGVRPAHMIKSFSEIDVNKYIELLQNTFEQVLESLDMDFETLISNYKQSTLEGFI